MKIETRYECHARDAKTGKAEVYAPGVVADVHPDDAANLIKLQGARAYDGETLAEKSAKKAAAKKAAKKPAKVETSKSTEDAAKGTTTPVATAKKPAGEGLL